MVVFMATGLEWVWVGRSAGAGCGDGHNSYCHSIGCRGHGVHDYVIALMPTGKSVLIFPLEM